MKRQKLSDYLVSIQSVIDQRDYNKTKWLCETALKKFTTFSYSPQDEYLLYIRLGYAYYNLLEFSSSIDIFYKAYLIADKKCFPPSQVAYTSFMLGHSFVSINNISQALAQFQKVEEYYVREKNQTLLMNSKMYVATLIGLGYCSLHQNELGKASEIIEDKLPEHHKTLLENKLLLIDYYHLKGEYFLVLKKYGKAKDAFLEGVRVSREIDSPRSSLEAKVHLAQIDLLEGQLENAIKILQGIMKDAKVMKLNDLISEAGLFLSKCYSIKNMPDRVASIEKRIKPFLSKLDIVWFYEKTREFEKLYRQLQTDSPSSPESQSAPAVLVKTLNHRYDTVPYKKMVIGSSESMREVFQLIEKIAPTDLPILIQGETGTGKELIAHAIHANSKRTDKTFLAFNCGAIPESLLESALFGHTKGAFTGAAGDKNGYIELASEGTLFIDEIGNMSFNMQQKFLRVLEEKLIWRIGATKPNFVNTRFIFASNQNIEQMVKRKLFREDLFYRINTIVLNLPTLRERKDDILLLVQHFLDKYSPKTQDAKRITPDALRLLTAYPWPGNIRELENEIERICVMHPDAGIIEGMISQTIRQYIAAEPPILRSSGSAKELLEEYEQRIIKETLKRYNGNIARTARELGYERRQFYRRLKHLKITETE